MENYNSFKIHQQQLEQNLEILDIRFEHRIWKMLNPKTIWFTQMYTDTVSTQMIPVHGATLAVSLICSCSKSEHVSRSFVWSNYFVSILFITAFGYDY